jgi:hypothetical protein
MEDREEMLRKSNLGKGKRALYLFSGAIVLLFTFASLALVLAAGTETVSIGSTGAFPGESVTEPIMVGNVANLGGGTIKVSYNSSVVHVTEVANGSGGDALTVIAWKGDNSTNPGYVRISALNTSGQTGAVIFADVTYKAVGAIGSSTPLNITVESLFDINYTDISYSVANGTFRIKDTIAPVVTNPNATPSVILNDNGRPRAVGTNITRLNVTVTDNNVGVASVSINLSPIGSSAAQPMALIAGTSMNGIWSVTTTASADMGTNLTNNLMVNATDSDGNSDTSVSIQLEVLRRGDIKRDNVVDMKDMTYIARYTVGLEPETSEPPAVFVGDVVGEAGDPTGDGQVDMKDALYIARWSIWLEPEP